MKMSHFSILTKFYLGTLGMFPLHSILRNLSTNPTFELDFEITIDIVVENNLWLPNEIRGDASVCDSSELCWIPLHVLIVPLLSRPDWCCHHFIPHVWNTRLKPPPPPRFMEGLWKDSKSPVGGQFWPKLYSRVFCLSRAKLFSWVE